MVVAMGCGDFVEITATVSRLPHLEVGHVDRVRVGGVRKHVGVVPGPVQQIAVRGYQFPRIAAVVRPVQPGFFALDQRPDAV